MGAIFEKGEAVISQQPADTEQKIALAGNEVIDHAKYASDFCDSAFCFPAINRQRGRISRWDFPSDGRAFPYARVGV
jgi:hypothetical protein